MRAEAADQRRLELGELGAQAALGQLGQQLGVAHAGDQGPKHRPAGDAQDVGGHARQLDAGVLQQLLQPLRLAGALLDDGLAVAGEVAQLPDRRGWHEAGADQAVLDQLADPLGVGDVGLAAGHVAQVAGVEQPAVHGGLQPVVHRLPGGAGRLHADHGHLLAGQPVPQRQQAFGGGGERAGVLLALPVLARGPHARRHRLLVDVQARAALDELVHAAPPLWTPCSRARRSLFSRSLSRVLAATLRGARGSRVRLFHGLTGTKADRRRAGRTPRFSSLQGGPTGP
jgi:hypothetical protein